MLTQSPKSVNKTEYSIGSRFEVGLPEGGVATIELTDITDRIVTFAVVAGDVFQPERPRRFPRDLFGQWLAGQVTIHPK